MRRMQCLMVLTQWSILVPCCSESRFTCVPIRALTFSINRIILWLRITLRRNKRVEITLCMEEHSDGSFRRNVNALFMQWYVLLLCFQWTPLFRRVGVMSAEYIPPALQLRHEARFPATHTVTQNLRRLWDYFRETAWSDVLTHKWAEPSEFSFALPPSPPLRKTTPRSLPCSHLNSIYFVLLELVRSSVFPSWQFCCFMELSSLRFERKAPYFLINYVRYSSVMTLSFEH